MVKMELEEKLKGQLLDVIVTIAGQNPMSDARYVFSVCYRLDVEGDNVTGFINAVCKAPGVAHAERLVAEE